MNSKYVMCNVVVYDGCDSWVSKFILRNSTDEERRKDIYSMNYDGQILLIDLLYELSPENIITIINSDENDKQLISERFKEMYL